MQASGYVILRLWGAVTHRTADAIAILHWALESRGGAV